MMKSINYAAAAFVAVLSASHSVLAQNEDRPSGTLDYARKRLEIRRVDSAPKLDGILDDPAWEKAAVISDMHQFQPQDHVEPSERSVFYLAYDERFLYVAARLYDDSPGGIIARQMVQGQGMPFDDAFEFILDTFNNGRTGYHFQANPNGIRREGIFENPNNLNRDWSGIWQVEARIDDEGWTAEVAIPFTTLNFDPETEEWGFTIARTIARKKEEIAWSSFNRNLNPGTTGVIYGIREIKQGRGLDVIPSLTLAGAEDHVANQTSQRTDPSLNVFYKFTPSLTGALTLNTDFSATEVDNRQVNLSRFSLFFPEKRDFFLQDVDIFNFGGLDENGIPFYSRRIGLSGSGQPVDIDTGLKLSGRIGRWNVGGLAVRQAAAGEVEEQTVMVARAAANILSESSIGAIFTQGDPTSNLDNSLAGVDFRYRNTRFSDSYTLNSNLWYQQSDTETVNGDDKAYGAQINLDTSGNGLGGGIQYQYFGEDFNPGLGFANRTGIESLDMVFGNRYRPLGRPVLREVFSFLRFSHQRRIDSGDMQTENIFFRFINFNTHRGDRTGFSYQRRREGLQRDFQISPGVVIPAGKYSFDRWQWDFEMAQERVFAPFGRIGYGDFYDGRRLQLRGGLNWRPDRHLFFSVSYDYQDIDLPQGEFDTRLVSMNANYAFNAKLSWVNLVQYDNGSDTVGINSRLRWNPKAGEDLFLVINYNFDSEGVFSNLNARGSELVLKYTRTFRF